MLEPRIYERSFWVVIPLVKHLSSHEIGIVSFYSMQHLVSSKFFAHQSRVDVELT